MNIIFLNFLILIFIFVISIIHIISNSEIEFTILSWIIVLIQCINIYVIFKNNKNTKNKINPL